MWRWLLGLAAMPAAMALVTYRMIPESPRYLSVVGKHDEAVKVRVSIPCRAVDSWSYLLHTSLQSAISSSV